MLLFIIGFNKLNEKTENVLPDMTPLVKNPMDISEMTRRCIAIVVIVLAFNIFLIFAYFWKGKPKISNQKMLYLDSQLSMTDTPKC